MRRIFGVGLVVAMGMLACTALKPATDHPDAAATDGTHGTDGAVTDMGLDCIDPTGFNGQGCFNCTATDRLSLLNHCTGSTCTPFDNHMRLPAGALVDGSLPMLPGVDAGSEGGVDATAMDSATDSGPPPTDAMGVDVPPVDSGVPLCSSLPNVVYVTGSSAVSLFLGQIAQALENATSPFTVVYQSSSSCSGVSAMLQPTSFPMTGNAIYWNPDPTVTTTSPNFQVPCRLPPGGVAADIGFSDVFPSTCQSLPSGLNAAGLNDYLGPIQVMTFVAPSNSMQHVISAEAAYLVFGFAGAQYPVAPWTDRSTIFQRVSSSGTQNMIAATIGLPPPRWAGVPNASSSGVLNAVLAQGMMGGDPANRTIGILAFDVVASAFDRLTVLAYQDYGQTCGFTPDSTPTSRDKRNVRDGHYPIWGPLHMVGRYNGATGMAVNASVQRLVNVINGVEVLHDTSGAPLDIVQTYAQRGLVPQCAMRVSRVQDGGEITASTAAMHSCGCYFEESATTFPPAQCQTCTRSSECPATAPNCNQFGLQGQAGHTTGYCEP